MRVVVIAEVPIKPQNICYENAKPCSARGLIFLKEKLMLANIKELLPGIRNNYVSLKILDLEYTKSEKKLC